MISLTPEDRLREAFVALADDERDVWLKVIERSGRLKTARTALLDRVCLAFGERNPTASEAFGRVLLKTGPQLPVRADQLLAVLAGAQLVEFFRFPSRSQTRPSGIDAAALAVRILARTSERPIFPDLAAHASAWLERRADAVRAMRPLQVLETEESEVQLDLEGVSVDVADPETMRVAHNHLGDQLTKLKAELENSRIDIEHATEAVDALEIARHLLVEQQQIGWWILGGPENPPLDWEGAYASASVLSELTRVIPGPRAAPALIRRRVGHGAWDPHPVVLDIPSPSDSRFTPALNMLRGEESVLADVQDAGEAVLAIYDEMLLARLIDQ